MKNRFSLLASFAALMLIVSWISGIPFEPLANAASAASPAQAAPAAQMSMQDMMKMHDTMMADMKAGQARLDDLEKKMNAATGDAKVAAMAQLVSELVGQHRGMNERMGGMSQRMMGQMKMMR
jgi:hypothetical protein